MDLQRESYTTFPWYVRYYRYRYRWTYNESHTQPFRGMSDTIDIDRDGLTTRVIHNLSVVCPIL